MDDEVEPDTLGELDHVNMGSRIGPWDQSSLEGQFDPETPEYPRIRRKSVLPMDSSVLTALTHHKSLEVCKKKTRKCFLHARFYSTKDVVSRSSESLELTIADDVEDYGGDSDDSFLDELVRGI